LTLEFILDVQRWGGGEPTAVGEGYSGMYKGKYYSLLYTRGGMFRGNHIHPNVQHTLLLDGKGKYVFKVDGREETYHLERGRILDVPAGVPHIFLPEDDCLTFEWWEGDFIAQEYDFPNYTKSIKKKVEEFDRKVQELKKTKK
jgi:oxalate decarboxylase/phosphoglucose isomerase-like protein (cupin superfamily)